METKKVSMKTLKEDAVEEEEEEADTQRPKEMLKLQKRTQLILRLNLLVIKFDSMFIFKQEKQLVRETWDNTYAFFPQMAPWYQLRQVLKYFLLVPMTCWSAQTLGLVRIEGEKGIKNSSPGKPRE